MRAIRGDVAEVGAFEGGNVLLALQSAVWPRDRKYYMLDSFEGFPHLSAADPGDFGRGDYRPERALEELLIPFNLYPEAKVIKGFVPDTFARLPDSQYALVFYDCDLYQPALDTFEYFWKRMVPGGIVLVHDYFAQPGGFAGVELEDKIILCRGRLPARIAMANRDGDFHQAMTRYGLELPPRFADLGLAHAGPAPGTR